MLSFALDIGEGWLTVTDSRRLYIYKWGIPAETRGDIVRSWGS
jgi:hypothetical protein